MERIEFLKSVIAHCTDEQAVAYAKNSLEKSAAYAKRKSGDVEKEREEMLNVILACVAKIQKPATVNATEINTTSQKAQSYCRILESRELVIVTTGASPVNSKRNVKYFKKA